MRKKFKHWKAVGISIILILAIVFGYLVFKHNYDSGQCGKSATKVFIYNTTKNYDNSSIGWVGSTYFDENCTTAFIFINSKLVNESKLYNDVLNHELAHARGDMWADWDFAGFGCNPFVIISLYKATGQNIQFHPERPFYWITTIFLFCTIFLIIYGIKRFIMWKKGWKYW